MSPFRRAVSEGSNRHRCVVQHHSLKSSHTFMALFGVIISHVLGFHKPPAGSYVSLHTYAPYVDTHILQKSRIKCRSVCIEVSERLEGVFEVFSSRRSFTDIHMEAARSLGASETPKRQASSSPFLPFCAKGND